MALDFVKETTGEKPKQDLHSKNVVLAQENERLRVAIMQIRDRASDLPHVLMPDGQTLNAYCRMVLTQLS